MARTVARDAAFRLLYQNMMGGGGGIEALVAMTEIVLSLEDHVYISDIVVGCESMEEELDDVIMKHVKGWEIDRIARTDLCLLRLATYEILRRDDIPASVSINEVVDLAHLYSSDEAPSFINGVLGSLAREVGKE